MQAVDPIIHAAGRVLDLFESRMVPITSRFLHIATAKGVCTIGTVGRTVTLPHEVLDDLRPVILITTGRPDERMTTCPLLAERVVNVAPIQFLSEVFRCCEHSSQWHLSVPDGCNRECVFADQQAKAVRRLRHDRFGKYIQFGIGKRLIDGAATADDFVSATSLIQEDLEKLASAFVECRFLAERPFPFQMAHDCMTEVMLALRSRRSSESTSETGTVSRALKKCLEIVS